MELLDHALLLQLGQEGPVLLVRAVADVDGVGLTEGHVGVHELSDGRAEGAEVALEDSGTALVLGLKLRRHDEGGGGGVWSERRNEGERRSGARGEEQR